MSIMLNLKNVESLLKRLFFLLSEINLICMINFLSKFSQIKETGGSFSKIFPVKFNRIIDFSYIRFESGINIDNDFIVKTKNILIKSLWIFVFKLIRDSKLFNQAIICCVLTCLSRISALEMEEFISIIRNDIYVVRNVEVEMTLNFGF